MQQIRKEIHTAFFSVAQLCEQFFKKYPQNNPSVPSLSPGYPTYQYGAYPPATHEYPSAFSDPWTKYASHSFSSSAKDSQLSKLSKTLKSETNEKQTSMKKTSKDEKKYEKKLQQFKIERQKQQRAQKKQKEMILKRQKKLRNTKKNLIRKDPRYAEKPKFPMSPYFLFLKEMRAKNAQNTENPIAGNKVLAEIVGKQWREMPEECKKPYITSYLKEKKVYDQQLKKYYEKYPDLKPKGTSNERPMYSIDDPKYQLEQQQEVEELETDLIDELRSEEEDSNENKGPDNRVNDSPNQDQNDEEQYEEQYEEDFQSQPRKIYEEKAPLEKNGSQHRKEVVEID